MEVLMSNIILVIVSIWAFIWILSVLWITKDVINRTTSTFFQIFSIILWTILWPIWLIIYIVLRPVWYIYDRNWWREAIIFDYINCNNCWTLNNRSHNFCIWCWKNLKIKCKECWNHYSYDRDYCPNCWAPNIDKW